VKRLRRIRLFHLDRFGKRLDESVDDEVRFHLETRIEQLMRNGRSREEARAEALEQFGDPREVTERCRRIDERGARRRAMTEFFSDALADVRFAVRSLRKARSYTVVTVVSLAVGIGVNSAFFSAIHAVWVAPVPGVTEQDRIVDPVVVEDGADWWGWSYPDFEAVRESDTPFESLAAWIEEDVTVGGEDTAERVHAAFASAAYFQVMGAVPARGRGFLPFEDAGPGQHPVAVVSHDLWQSRFDGRADILGQTVTLNRVPYTIVGVAPPAFRGARVTLGVVDLWVPLVEHPGMQEDGSVLRDRDRFPVQVLGRLRNGATRAEAQPALQTVFSRLSAAYPETNENRTVRAEAYRRFPAQNRFWDMIAVAGLWGLMGILLLIICGNLAGMSLARSASREQEIGVRLALGSSRLRLVRHLMVEAVLLALVGGCVGTALAMLGMASVSPPDLGIAAPGVTFQPSGWVLAMSLGLALAAALVFGLIPAIRFSRPELVSSLKDDIGGGGRRVGRIQRLAASAQTGAALCLLAVGVLFLRSLTRTGDDDLGFQPRGMVVTDFRVGSLSSLLLDVSEEGYPTLDGGGGALLDQLKESLGSLPGVAAAALGDGVPLDRSGNFGRVAPVDWPDEAESRVLVEFTRVTEDYFQAIGAPVLQGRGFRPGDDDASEPVMVITRPLAERLWPGQSALGQQLLWPAGSEGAAPRIVVGVVERVASSRASEDWPHVFIPLRQSYSPNLMIVLRTATETGNLAGPFRDALRSADPGLPMPRLLPGESIVARATEGQRANGTLGGGLGLLVLLLSAIGVYGVVSLAVTHRTREIGLRMAMGATRGEIVRRVLGDAVRLSAPGMIVGALLAAGTAVAMRSMLLGRSPLDPVSFLSAGGLLLVVVLAAALGPAHRASGIQPVRALKSD
jgi:macrolide transport system ATP-binding/permease protein